MLTLINGKVYLSCNKIGDNYFECFYCLFRDGSIVRTGVEDFSLERLKSCTKLYNIRVYNGFISSGLSGRHYTDSTNLYILADKSITMSSLSRYIVDNDEIFDFARLERVYSGFAKNLFQFSSAWSEFISRIEEYPEKNVSDMIYMPDDTTDTTEDTTEDTTDTTEDTTEDTTDTTEDTTDTTEDTTDTKYTVALGFLDDIPFTCLSFKWCHAPFDAVKACYNCAFNHSCDTAIKYSFTTDNFQIVPLWVYSKYNINPLTALIYALVKFLKLKEIYSAPCLYPVDSDGIIIIDDVFFSEEMPF